MILFMVLGLLRLWADKARLITGEIMASALRGIGVVEMSCGVVFGPPATNANTTRLCAKLETVTDMLAARKRKMTYT